MIINILCKQKKGLESPSEGIFGPVPEDVSREN